jgi:hypothetical protein
MITATRASARSTLRLALMISVLAAPAAHAQLTDLTQAPNPENAGIVKSLNQQIGAGVDDVMTPGSSIFIIKRDPARAIRRGRQLFQRKFTAAQGFGPRTNDGIGDISAASRNAFNALSDNAKNTIFDFLSALVLFPPHDTASNLDPGNSARVASLSAATAASSSARCSTIRTRASE